ncbi:family 16 glycosylhydrolase [Streptomyces sp. NPDC060194]|uniref:glycoside hydrolase family 16 protein n=1 Tax=Streptomyces sp. NPDC060194 TaxID=3347069 RepID=UPI00365A161B
MESIWTRRASGVRERLRRRPRAALATGAALTALTVLIGWVLLADRDPRRASDGSGRRPAPPAATPSTPTASRWVDPATPRGVRPRGGAGTGSAELVFSDEFGAPTLDTAKWTALDVEREPHDGIRWWYAPGTVRPDAAGRGALAIDVKRLGEGRYAGGRIETRGKYGYHGGAIEFRVHVPPTEGHLAAVWLQHPDQGDVPGTAADGAEIDIAETAYRANRFSTNIHYDGYDDLKSSPGVFPAPRLHDDYWHTFGLSWTGDHLKFLYDGRVVRTVTDERLIPLVDEFVVISHEVSDFPEGDIEDETFDADSTMYVDYVRIWK